MSTKKAPMPQKNDKKNASRPIRGGRSPSFEERRAPRGMQNKSAGKQSGKQSGKQIGSKSGVGHKDRGDSLRAPNNSYFLWGHHALGAALANHNRRIKALYTTTDGQDRLMQMMATLPEARLSQLPVLRIVERHQLDNLPQAANEAGKIVHQGMVAAVSPLETHHLDDFLDSLSDEGNHRLMVLDQVSDPRNVGAILRSARAFGTKALILQDRHAPEETGGLARTAVGALEEIALIRVVNLARAIEMLKEYHFHIAGLDMDGSTDTSPAQNADRLALVMGSEGKGMRRLTSEACDEILSIAMADTSESLNVSVAAAIMMHSTQKPAS